MEEQLKEMLGKRPDELEGETLKLFEAIMKIADERDELKVRNKELEETLKDNWEFRDKCYIPKSKVKEKIEYIGKLYTEDEIDCEWYSEMKQLLQELLEE